MTSGMVWIILLCGVGTFLLRWLPLWRARHRRQAGRATAVMQKLLVGVGPSAIAALLIVSAWGLFANDIRPGNTMMVVLALGCTAATRWACRGGVAVPTLVGSLVYGVLAYVSV